MVVGDVGQFGWVLWYAMMMGTDSVHVLLRHASEARTPTPAQACGYAAAVSPPWLASSARDLTVSLATAIDDVPVPVSDAFTQSGHDEASTKLAESGDPPGWSLERVLAVFYTPVETMAVIPAGPRHAVWHCWICCGKALMWGVGAAGFEPRAPHRRACGAAPAPRGHARG